MSDFLLQREVKNLPFYEDGKMNAQLRNATLSLFHSGKVQVLVCNNLAARGINLPNCEHVIQFEYAKSPIDYLQRAGRCGRLGQPGKLTNFVRKSDSVHTDLD